MGYSNNRQHDELCASLKSWFHVRRAACVDFGVESILDPSFRRKFNRLPYRDAMRRHLRGFPDLLVATQDKSFFIEVKTVKTSIADPPEYTNFFFSSEPLLHACDRYITAKVETLYVLAYTDALKCFHAYPRVVDELVGNLSFPCEYPPNMRRLFVNQWRVCVGEGATPLGPEVRLNASGEDPLAFISSRRVKKLPDACEYLEKWLGLKSPISNNCAC